MDKVIVILGPTATGKSALGVELAKALGGEIINADALQAYRELEIGTDKPSLAVRREIPHHLVDILDPQEVFSAGEFARRARAVLSDLRQRAKVPIVVGGSGLYLRALLEGLSPIPRDLAMRQRLAARLSQEGLDVLYAELAERDAATAARLAPGDRQRILRALEVTLATGRPLSDWIRRQPSGSERLSAVRIGLTLPRSILYDRIADRVKQMIEQGWVAEVIAMLNRGVDPAAPAFQAIGYRQMVRHVNGHSSLEEAIDDTIRATRRYAKRQVTWFNKEKDVRWISALERPRAIPSLLEKLRCGGGRFSG